MSPKRKPFCFGIGVLAMPGISGAAYLLLAAAQAAVQDAQSDW